MTASSVTGLHKNGVGGVDGSNKGSERMTLGVGHLIGVRVVAAGVVTLDGDGAITVTLPVSLDASESEHAVLLTPEAAPGANGPYVSARADDGDGHMASFTITEASGAGAYDVNWVIIRL